MEYTSTKAVVATVATTVLAFLGALQVALTDGSVSSTEWITIAVATITAATGVGVSTYASPANKPKSEV